MRGFKEVFGRYKPEDTKNEAEFIRQRDEKQKQTKLKPKSKSNVIYVDFVNKIRIK